MPPLEGNVLRIARARHNARFRVPMLYIHNQAFDYNID
jgi:hypothetical protein